MNKRRKGPNPRSLQSVFLTAILLIGCAIGCCYAVFIGDLHLLPGWNTSDSLSNTRWLALYSEFLFDPLLFLCIVFIFGQTFLGVAVIPATLFSKGFMTGLSLNNMQKGILLYIKEWLTFYPAALCIVVLILFSVYAFRVSLQNCRLVFGKSTLKPQLKQYTLLFFLALSIFAVSGLFYYIVFLLLEILL